MADETVVTSGNEMVGSTPQGVIPSDGGQANPQEQVMPAQNGSSLAQQNSSSDSQNSTAWIGAVKKESRDKGYQEGYAKALEELKNQHQKEAAPENPAPAQPAAQSNQQPATNHQYDPKKIAAEAAELAKQQQMADNYTRIGMEGVTKFGDDYRQKGNEYIEQINTLSNHQDQQSQQIAAQMQMALAECANVGGSDMTYKLFNDENFRNDLLGSNPVFWRQKLMSYQMNAQPNAHQMASQVIRGEPNDTSTKPSSTSYGNMAEKSWEERRRAVR